MILVPVVKSAIGSYKSESVNVAQSNVNTGTVVSLSMPTANISEKTEVLQTPQPSASVNLKEEKIFTQLTASSGENDLYIFVRDSQGNPICGECFKISVKYPTGEVGTYNTQSDGSCYLINLAAGMYTISMAESSSYLSPEQITCQVNDRISYTFIEDISDIVEVTDETQILNEIKTNESEGPEVIVAEEINTAESIGSSYVYDSNGNIEYTYEWKEDIDGHLLDSGGNSTDVFPYYEEDGILLFGIRINENSTTEEVKLINDDNTPVEGYMITATPVMQSSSQGWINENNSVYYIMEDGTKAVGLKIIDGKLYYFYDDGKKASSIGIDVSFYNGTVNWSTVKNYGIDFVIIRLGGRGWGTGALYDDSCFYNYINGAKAAGLKVGVYFYSTAVNRVEAVQEASIVLDRLGGTSLDYPVYIDMEYSGDYPNGRSDKLSKAQRVEICLAFLETIKNSGYSSGVYCSESFLSDELDYGSISSYSIWMASYTENNKLPSTEYNYNIWQITDRGRVTGINGNCDINIIR